MSTSATGRLVDENGAAWAGFTVVARDVSPLFDEDLGTKVADGQGRFALTYDRDFQAGEFGPRTIEFTVLDKVHRRVARFEREDVSASVLALGDIVVKRIDAAGYLVTLGTGAAARVTTGNAVDVLIDNERTWEKLCEHMKKARLSIDLLQLFFEVPSRFKADESKEHPMMVLHFAENPPMPRRVGGKDARPERVLYTAADRGIDVRILLNRFQVEGHALGASLVVPGLGLVLLLLLVYVPLEAGGMTSVNEVDFYFDEANKAEDGGETIPHLKVYEARSPLFGPTHAKQVIIDRADRQKAIAFILGSPFEQKYFGDFTHAVDDSRRGHHTDHPVHDVNLAVRGPAVADLHAAFKLYWDNAESADPEDPEPVPAIEPPLKHELGASIAAIQVVRTLDTGRFPDPEDGEQGILEAYLRAIANARQLIYLENQFFTNEAIAAALTRALKDPSRPDLQVIVLLNIRPDTVLYARRQRKLIVRMRESLTDFERARLGIFTRWTHEGPKPPKQPRPRITPTYVHSKVAVVDDEWATIGSANLDGTSLDVTHYFQGLTFGDVRANEINCLILNGVDGQPETFVVDQLRRELWAEHLGYVFEGHPEPDNEELVTPPVGGWLALWDERAGLKRSGLRSDPTTVSPIGVLPWPHVDKTLKYPREHLEAALGMKLTNLDPIESTREFSFVDGHFKYSRPMFDD